MRPTASAAVPALFGLLLLGCPSTPPPPSPAPSRPTVQSGSGMNLLLITIDTLRADHLGLYGYRRATSPQLDRLAGQATVFEQAYTFWPKTRGSFVMMMTGRTPGLNGYSKKHPMVLGFNATLADTLRGAGYLTAAFVDNPNLAPQYGYDRGFARYRATFNEPALATEMDRTRAITADAQAFLAQPPSDRPFFLWLHYVNPHGPYEPPPPFENRFMDAASQRGPKLALVDGFHGGVRREWARGADRPLGYYVALYDAEIATVDAEVGSVLAALESGGAGSKTAVIVSSDHGESLGERGYYFDHGEDLFDACLRVPLLVAVPRMPARRVTELASTLDLMPTLLDLAKVAFPPDLAGRSLLPAVEHGRPPERERLQAQNERNLTGTFDQRFKLVATPASQGVSYELFDRGGPAAERQPSGDREALRILRREHELYLEREQRAWSATSARVGDARGPERPNADLCEKLKALGYVDDCP